MTRQPHDPTMLDLDFPTRSAPPEVKGARPPRPAKIFGKRAPRARNGGEPN